MPHGHFAKSPVVGDDNPPCGSGQRQHALIIVTLANVFCVNDVVAALCKPLDDQARHTLISKEFWHWLFSRRDALVGEIIGGIGLGRTDIIN